MSIRLADEHDASAWVLGMLTLIAEIASDSRRGIEFDPETPFQVEVPNDSGGTTCLTLTVNYDF